MKNETCFATPTSGQELKHPAELLKSRQIIRGILSMVKFESEEQQRSVTINLINAIEDVIESL
ncbi:hypothetical protein HGB13_00050 [bacterium]|nr:hypothetical protein [bacterium]